MANFNELSKLGLIKFIEDYDQYVQSISEDPRNKMMLYPYPALELLNTVIEDKAERFKVPPINKINTEMLVDEYAYKIGDEVEACNYAGDCVGDQIWNTDSIAYCAKPFLRKYYDQVSSIVSNVYEEKVIQLEQKIDVLEKEIEELKVYVPHNTQSIIIDDIRPVCKGNYSL